MFELDSRRLDMVGEDVVQAPPLLYKIEALQSLEPANFVETDDSALVKSDQQFATRA